jgi:hypothetical protein
MPASFSKRQRDDIRNPNPVETLIDMFIPVKKEQGQTPCRDLAWAKSGQGFTLGISLSLFNQQRIKPRDEKGGANLFPRAPIWVNALSAALQLCLPSGDIRCQACPGSAMADIKPDRCKLRLSQAFALLESELFGHEKERLHRERTGAGFGRFE